MTKSIFLKSWSLSIIALTLVSPAFPSTARCQSGALTTLDFATGTELEDYLRVLQVAGVVAPYPWSVRAFSRREIERLVQADTTGPWHTAARLSKRGITAGPVTATEILNTSYPYGANDGPVWAGRGLTSVLSGGISAGLGPVSISIAPVAFSAENVAFDLLPNGFSDQRAFNHGTFSETVDLPQRFGAAAYSRLDPGTSSVRLDTRLLTLGVSTANEWIGPATEYPFLLSDNAPGFPHIFAGTGEPLNVGIGRLHARMMWGKLYQSAYSPQTGGARFTIDYPGYRGRVRLMTSSEFVFLPRGIPGLELGFGRFFHVPYRPNSPDASFWKKPFRVFFLKNEIAQGDTAGFDNQLASIFFRWVFPNSGLELFGERGYEDQFYDFRDFLQDPDHDRSYMLGLQKVMKGKGRLDVIRGELINYQLPTLARVRIEDAVYLHTFLTQGHTNRGQLLGASPGVGAAAASTLAWTRYTSGGRTTFTLRRIVRDERGNYPATKVEDPRGSDVILSVGGERMWMRSRFDFGVHAEAMQNYNRNFSSDVPNLNLQLTSRWHLQ